MQISIVGPAAGSCRAVFPFFVSGFPDRGNGGVGAGLLLGRFLFLLPRPAVQPV